jgi:hypothetical protein
MQLADRHAKSRRAKMTKNSQSFDINSLPVMSKRRKDAVTVFGKAKQLPSSKLPTAADIGSYYMSLKDRHNAPRRHIVDDVARDVLAVWQRASVPTIADISVHRRILAMVDKVATWKRNGQEPSDDFMASLPKLFDICSCTCYDLQSCSCPKNRKVIIVIFVMNHLVS